MIRSFHLADWITVGNSLCGMGAMFAAVSFVQTPTQEWHLLIACVLIVAALVFDILDGKVARWRHQGSPLGRELDSLADAISFGAAPAVIAYAAGMQGLWDRVVLLFFVACGVSRLARFNVTAEEMAGDDGKVSYYEGTPIPTSVLLVAVIAIATWLGDIGDALWGGMILVGPWQFHPLVLMFAISGSLMISTFRIPKP
ncbi:MAG: CDP-diacylglycerol--serine O-phosphatidyltransferase [Betaproteobacteria bacterium]|nr:CDP-diacylglycerol--serine O-phosphatidyltransferase [Betaproteobacteria bacterium]